MVGSAARENGKPVDYRISQEVPYPCHVVLESHDGRYMGDLARLGSRARDGFATDNLPRRRAPTTHLLQVGEGPFFGEPDLPISYRTWLH